VGRLAQDRFQGVLVEAKFVSEEARMLGVGRPGTPQLAREGAPPQAALRAVSADDPAAGVVHVREILINMSMTVKDHQLQYPEKGADAKSSSRAVPLLAMIKVK
jgi:hypothetical protein